MGIEGYPTIKVLFNQFEESYVGHGDPEDLKQFALHMIKRQGTKGGSSVCPFGVYYNQEVDSPVPLCEAHFPDAKSKNDWLIVFYDSKADDAKDLKDLVNRAALELGNEPRNKPKGKKSQMK